MQWCGRGFQQPKYSIESVPGTKEKTLGHLGRELGDENWEVPEGVII
jgi:hypothetical protein